MSNIAKNVDPAITQYVQDCIASALAEALPDIKNDLKILQSTLTQLASQQKKDTVAASQVVNIDEIIVGFKAQIDTAIRNVHAEVSTHADATCKRCDETDDLVRQCLAQIAELEVRLRKYTDGDRYSITKRQVARLMREQHG